MMHAATLPNPRRCRHLNPLLGIHDPHALGGPGPCAPTTSVGILIITSYLVATKCPSSSETMTAVQAPLFPGIYDLDPIFSAPLLRSRAFCGGGLRQFT
ncbi:MAG: hypothetical protein WBL87_09115 [Methanothrix sp.]